MLRLAGYAEAGGGVDKSPLTRWRQRGFFITSNPEAALEQKMGMAE